MKDVAGTRETISHSPHLPPFVKNIALIRNVVPQWVAKFAFFAILVTFLKKGVECHCELKKKNPSCQPSGSPSPGGHFGKEAKTNV